MHWIRSTFVCFMLASILLSSSAQYEAVVALEFASCASYSYNVNEGLSRSLCAILLYVNGSATLVNDVTVLFVPVNGTARYPADFPDITYNTTFPAGSAPQLKRCVNIDTVSDTDVENNEAFTVRLVAANPSAVQIGDRVVGTAATINILDNDNSVFTLDGNYSAVEGTSSFQVCAVLYSGSPTITGVNLRFTANPITATATTDYSVSATIVGVTVGAQVGNLTCVTVSIVNDNLVENNETFSIVISGNSKTAVIAGRTISYITIIDNDVVVMGLFSSNTLQGSESNTSIPICVVITNSNQLAITVAIQVNTADVTATSGLDFLLPSPPMITFPAGSMPNNPICTNFQILQDSVVESNEYLLIYLQSTLPQVQVLPAAGNATFTIIEDGDTVLIGFSSIAIDVSEGVNAQICAQIKSGSIGISVSVSITTTTLGSATANVDYEPLTLATIAFNPGSSASVNSTSCSTLVIMDDDAVENDETISLSMSALTPVNIQQSTSFAVVTIREDASDSISVGFGNSIQVTEGLNLTATVCAMIFHGSLQVSVSMLAFTSNITANPSVDYETKSVTITFTSGKTVGDSVCFTIGIYNDLIVENPELLSVNLQSIDSRAVVAPGQGQITVTIYDDPNDVITLGFQNPQYRTTETSLPISICVLMLSGQLGKDVPIGVTTSDQTAVGGMDYIPLNTTIIFRSGMVAGNSLCVSIGLLNDNFVEANQESFLVSISGTDPAAVIEAGTSPVYIDEDTGDVVVAKMSSLAISVTEMSTTSVCAELDYTSGILTFSVTATLIFSGTATDVTDYTISQRMFVFPAYAAPGVTSQSCATLLALGDALTEGAENVVITLTSSTSVLTIDSAFAATTVTITDV